MMIGKMNDFEHVKIRKIGYNCSILRLALNYNIQQVKLDLYDY